MWQDVYADFADLPKHEQLKLFNLTKEDFFSDEDKESFKGRKVRSKRQ